MKRTELHVGARSLIRGSTFAAASSALKRTTIRPERQPVSAASPEQRRKVADAVSIVSAERGCDPAHVWPRGRGGCDHQLCVVPLTRTEHDLFDVGGLDLLPHLLAHGLVAELQHALGHADGNLIALLQRVTGERWAPTGEREVMS